MKSTIYLMIMKAFYAILTIGSALETADSDVKLISAIFEYSKSSSVDLFYFFENDDSLKKDLIFDIRVFLMKKRIASTVINYESMQKLDSNKLNKFLDTREDESTMRVFFLMSRSELDGLCDSANYLSDNQLINLVFFMKSDDDDFLNECTNQYSNPFYFHKGVSVLFKCHGDPVIREWHSLSRRKMEMYERGTWRYETGLTLKSKELILDDMGKLNGKILIAGIIQNLNIRRRKYLTEIFTTLKQAGNLTIYHTKNHRRWNASSSMIEPLSHRLPPDLYKDFSVYAQKSLDSYDHSEILVEIVHKFFIKRPESRIVVFWSAYLEPFTVGVWIILVLFFIVFQVIRLFMKIKLQTDVLKENSEVTDFFDICAIYCQQSLPEFPKVLSIKILYCSIFFFSTIVMIMWSATFIGELTIVDENLPFKSVAEFLEQRTHTLIVTQSSVKLYDFLKTTRVPLWKELGHLLGEWHELPKTDNEVIEMISQGSHIALMRPHNSDIFVDYEKISSIITIVAGGTNYLSIPLRSRGPYTSGINQILKKLKCAGILKRISSVQRREWKSLVSHEASWRQYPSVDIQGVTVPFLILLGAMILSVMILFFEILHFKRKLKMSKPTRPLAARPWKRNKKLLVQNLRP